MRVAGGADDGGDVFQPRPSAPSRSGWPSRRRSAATGRAAIGSMRLRPNFWSGARLTDLRVSAGGAASMDGVLEVVHGRWSLLVWSRCRAVTAGSVAVGAGRLGRREAHVELVAVAAVARDHVLDRPPAGARQAAEDEQRGVDAGPRGDGRSPPSAALAPQGLLGGVDARGRSARRRAV